MKLLNEKQKRFCEQYIIDLNATRAAKEAGYSEKTACKIGSENLSKPDIQSYIQNLRLKQQERTEITADMVIKEFAAIAFANVEDIVKYNNEESVIKPEEERPKRAKKSLKKIKFTRKIIGRGEEAEEVETIEVELHDKLNALDKLARHLGIYEKDNSQQLSSGIMLVPISSGQDDWESLAIPQQKELTENDD